MVVKETSLSYLMMSLFTGMPGMSWITIYRPGIRHFTVTDKYVFFKLNLAYNNSIIRPIGKSLGNQCWR